MTTAHLAKMRAAKAAADERRRVENERQTAAYREWVAAEAAAHKIKIAIREEYGYRSPQYAEALEAWIAVTRSMPTGFTWTEEPVAA